MLAVLPWRLEISGAIAVGEVETPRPAAGEVLVCVAAAGLNRADLLQMRGLYPPPPGASAVPGLECAGIVEALGDGVTGFAIGDRVMALLAGGGQAERTVVPAGQLMPIPPGVDLLAAGGIPEAALTSWTNLIVEGGLCEGETVLVTGATSGIGTFAVQMIRELGGRAIAAARSPERLERLRDLGVEQTVTLDADYTAAVRALTGGRGVDLVLDLVGGEWFAATVGCLRPQGRLVLVGLTAGSKTQFDLGLLLRQRLRVVGSTLRSRPPEEKAALVRAFAGWGLPRLADGRLRPVIEASFPLAEAAEAYALLEHERPFGKVVLSCASAAAARGV